MRTTDPELLARYRRNHAEAAFAELVRRHLNLVYSAAFRQVRNPQLAEEIAQSVFVDLARNIPTLKPETVLTAWLYQVTRRTAIDVIRREARRHSREQIAAELNAMNTPDANWTLIEPFLDEAMATLEEADRSAVLLRFFENKSLREVGDQLGISDDAAQKRLRRAIEQLRKFFTKHRIRIGTSGITVTISAHAVQAAPMGLALTISTAALTECTFVATATIATTQTIAMTTFTKIVIGTILTAAIGTGIYQARQNSHLRSEIQSLQQQAQQSEQLKQERAGLTDQLAALQNENDRAQSNSTELLKLRSELARLRAAQSGSVRASNPVTNSTETNANTSKLEVELSKDSWSDAGFASVESALQTRGWAVLNGNRERFKESVFITPEAKQIMEKMLEDMINAAPAAERKKFSQMILDNNLGFEEAMLMPMMAENQSKGYTSYQILSQQAVSPDETLLQVATKMSYAPTKTETFRYRRFDHDWKLIIDEQFMKANR